jgi:mRNA interferase RelE/StbE
MVYKLEISDTARKDLAKLDKAVLQSVRDRLKKLAENAETLKHLALKGNLAGLYKLRVHGKYRVIYDLQHDKQLIVIVRFGKRSDIYKE